LIAAAALAVGSTAASAATILGVDFNVAANPGATPPTGESPTQAGFQSFPVTSGTAIAMPVSNTYAVSDPSVTSNAITATIANGLSATSTGNLLTRDRGAPADTGSFTYGSLYRDLIIGNPSNSTLTLQLTGLNPNTPYDVTLFAYDNNNPGAITLTDVTGGTPHSSAAYTFTGASSNFTSTTPNDIFGRTLHSTSAADGSLTFTATDVTTNGPNQAILNGFRIDTPTPEPTSFTLVALAATPLLRRRRR
jgi:hypothetical protein